MTARERRAALVHRIAAELDKPSLYMGGPSLPSRRKAERIVDLTDDHYQGAVLPPEIAAVAATLVDLAKHSLPPHISEAQQVEAYLGLRRIAGGQS